MEKVARINERSTKVAVNISRNASGFSGLNKQAWIAAWKAGANQARYGGSRKPPEGMGDAQAEAWDEGYVAMRITMGQAKSARRIAEMKVERRAAKAVGDLFGYPEPDRDNVVEFHATK